MSHTKRAVSGRVRHIAVGILSFTAWHSMAQHGTAWHSMAWLGTAWHGLLADAVVLPQQRPSGTVLP